MVNIQELSGACCRLEPFQTLPYHCRCSSFEWGPFGGHHGGNLHSASTIEGVGQAISWIGDLASSFAPDVRYQMCGRRGWCMGRPELQSLSNNLGTDTPWTSLVCFLLVSFFGFLSEPCHEVGLWVKMKPPANRRF